MGQDYPATRDAARRELNTALEGLRHASDASFIPRGLLTRAGLRILEDDADGARADLDQAWQIAERGSMKVHMANIHLHRARLFRDKEKLKQARAMIERCGYWRRQEELKDAEKVPKLW